MSKPIFKEENTDVSLLFKRDRQRTITFKKATIRMVGYFVGLGDTVDDANDKVDQIGYELRHPDKLNLQYAMDGYIQGSSLCKADLLNGINSIDEVAYPFMDTDAKNFLIAILDPQ